MDTDNSTDPLSAFLAWIETNIAARIACRRSFASIWTDLALKNASETKENLSFKPYAP